MIFGSIVTAMVTPFNNDLDIDYQNLPHLVEHLIQTGTETIIIAGTTGEGPTLTLKEKTELASAVNIIADGRAKVVVNVGSNNTKQSIEDLKEIEKINPDGYMLVNPYYNKPSQEGLYEHFKTIAYSTEKPIILYNIPGRTSVNLEADTTIKLSKIQNIVAVKEASGDLLQAAKIIENTPDNFAVYSGDDALLLPLLSVGGHGVISVASHVVGENLKELIESFHMGDVKKAATIHRKLIPLFEGLFKETNPVPLKALLNELHIPVGSVRLPLTSMKNKDVILQMKEHIEKINKENTFSR